MAPDNSLPEVTAQRVGDVLVADGVEFETEEVDGREIVRTGYNNCAIAFTLDDDAVICDSLWRGQVSLSDGAALLALINQWNQHHFTPTLRFFEQQGSHLVVSAYRRTDVSCGLSEKQLGYFVLSSMEAVREAFAAVEERFPELVTWRYTP